jgi:peptidoglycan/xylan/chitin deacetylase (PgdA/CDA1 family)
MAAVRANARRMAHETVKRVAAGADRLRPPPRGVIVLLYHRVGRRSPVEVDLELGIFRAQMETLAESGRVATIDDAVAMLRGEEPTRPLDPVVITFDDGTADFVETAVPVLVELGIPATLYVATDHIESRRPFPAAGRPVSWAALADACDTGLVTVGSHTHSHALLDRLAPADASDELGWSCALIEERLGTPARHFAYPKAVRPSPANERLVRQRFASAALAGTRANAYGTTDVHRLARSPVQQADGMRWFAHKLAGGLALEDGLRRVANRARYAGATT